MNNDQGATPDGRRLSAVTPHDIQEPGLRPTLERITQLARAVCRVPAALVSLIDGDRQVFVAFSGPPQMRPPSDEVRPSHSFCRHVSRVKKPVIVPDAGNSPLVDDGLAVPDAGVAAYLGVPIFDAGGQAVGSVCVVDTVPRAWSADDLALLETLALQIASDVQLRHQSTALARQLAEQQLIETDRQQVTRLNVHDLRTPLTALLMGLDLMQQLGTLDDTQTELLALARRNGTTLVNLVNNLIDIGSLDHRGPAALSRRACTPADLAAAAVRQVAALARDKKIDVRVDVAAGTPAVRADGEKIERVLVNLLANAVKFTDDHGRVAVRVSGRDVVRFSVEDTGIGMDDAGRIFDEGVRLDAAALSPRSAGLGLTFCKRTVEAHGGRIWCDTRPGGGSAFHFTLPDAAAGAA